MSAEKICRCGHTRDNHSTGGCEGTTLRSCPCRRYRQVPAAEPEHIEVAPGQQDGAAGWTQQEWLDFYRDHTATMEAEIASIRAALTQAREQVRDLAQGVIDEYSPCVFDENRPRLRWCMTHNTKRCTQKELADKARSALAASQPGKET